MFFRFVVLSSSLTISLAHSVLGDLLASLCITPGIRPATTFSVFLDFESLIFDWVSSFHLFPSSYPYSSRTCYSSFCSLIPFWQLWHKLFWRRSNIVLCYCRFRCPATKPVCKLQDELFADLRILQFVNTDRLSSLYPFVWLLCKAWAWLWQGHGRDHVLHRRLCMLWRPSWNVILAIRIYPSIFVYISVGKKLMLLQCRSWHRSW